MAKKLKTPKPTELERELFAQYARTAPLGDLRFYLRAAERRLAQFELPAACIRVIAEMTQLEQELIDVDGTPALKRRVWTLIDRFKASVPGWGRHNLGAAGYFVDALDSDKVYWKAREAAVIAKVKQTDPETGKTKIVEEDAAGPISEAQVLAFHGPALKRAEDLRRELTPARGETLSDEAVRALIVEHTVAPVVEAAKPKATKSTTTKVRKDAPQVLPPSPAALTCPTCKGDLLPVACAEHVFGCATCKETWHLVPVRTKARTVKAGATVHTPRVVAEVSEDGTRRKCVVCATWQDAAEFQWGDGGRTMRNQCKSCRKQQQRDAAAARRTTTAA